VCINTHLGSGGAWGSAFSAVACLRPGFFFFVNGLASLSLGFPGYFTGQALMAFGGKQNAGEPTVTVAFFYVCLLLLLLLLRLLLLLLIYQERDALRWAVGASSLVLPSSGVCWDLVVWASVVSGCSGGR
jgi:hypothetical protein